MYNPNFELGTSNWIDGFETTNDVVVDMEVETRGIAGVPEIQIKPTAMHRELPAGNKIVFLAYDPIALNTALSDDYSYYHWVGYDSSNAPYQTLKWFGIDIVTDVNDDSHSSIPKEFSLNQNYPNPFNPTTKISWQSPAGSWQTLKIYDVLGNEVATLVDEYKPAGRYEVEFDSHSDKGQNLSSGVYFYQLKAGDFIQTRKMIFIK
ncbi:MAG: T9SS type A sorting domain-containing protein [Ignavibacteriales bacterium]|nr:T9SS type A sorting domain-containing protein [Ignavibacteriales bacterium]